MSKPYRVSITYEFDGAIEPLHRVEQVACGSYGTAANRALRAAKNAWKGRRPVSIVLVIDRPS